MSPNVVERSYVAATAAGQGDRTRGRRSARCAISATTRPVGCPKQRQHWPSQGGRTVRTIVVGGGISGILCAAMAADDGEVVLVEGAHALGGLLASEDGPHGSWFDQGTHIPQTTGHEAVDAILFGAMDRHPWRELDRQRAGNFTFGVLNEMGPFPDLRCLPPQVYSQAMVELIESALDPPITSPRNAEEDLVSGFGSTITEHLFAPVLCKRFGIELRELAPGAHELFMSRVIGLTEQTTRELKRLPALDLRLGYHSSADGASTRRSWYPEEGGCGRWIEDLRRDRLADVGVRLATKVSSMRRTKQRVTEIELSSGEVEAADRVIWALAPARLLPLLGRTRPEGVAPAEFLRTDLHHLIIDRPFLTELHYVNCFDPSVGVSRITLYPGLRGDASKPPFSCTAEVTYPPERRSERAVTPDEVLDQLRSVGVVPAEARLVWATSRSIPMGFPVQSLTFQDDAARIAAAAVEGIENITIAGRGGGQAFFLSDVLQDCYTKMQH